MHIYEPYYTSWYSLVLGILPTILASLDALFWHFYYGYHYHWWVYYNTYRPWHTTGAIMVTSLFTMVGSTPFTTNSEYQS